MPKAIDLTGKKFGRLTVIKRDEEKTSRVYWTCRCDCGNYSSVLTNVLTSGRAKSCGCLRKELSSLPKGYYKDLTGKTFGQLQVLEFAYMSNCAYWKCKCSCGKIKIASTANILSGKTQSCGCLKITNAKKIGEYAVKSGLLKQASMVGQYKGTKIGQLSKKISTNNTSGHKGIDWIPKENRWRVRITLKGVRIYVGRYEKLEDAINARKEAERKYFKPVIEEFKQSKL